MKEKIAIALVILSLGALFSACGDTDNKNSGNISSSMNENIPENNSDGEYDNDENNNNNSSKGLDDKVSSFVSSEKQMIDSLVD